MWFSSVNDSCCLDSEDDHSMRPKEIATLMERVTSYWTIWSSLQTIKQYDLCCKLSNNMIFVANYQTIWSLMQTIKQYELDITWRKTMIMLMVWCSLWTITELVPWGISRSWSVPSSSSNLQKSSILIKNNNSQKEFVQEKKTSKL